MIELVVLGGAVALMAKAANTNDDSAVLWGMVTLLCCGFSLLLPWPFLRILIGLAASAVLYTVYQTRTG